MPDTAAGPMLGKPRFLPILLTCPNELCSRERPWQAIALRVDDDYRIIDPIAGDCPSCSAEGEIA